MRERFAKEKTVLTLSLLLIGGASLFVRGQFTASEIAQREPWEDFLKTAEIVKSELIGEGVTKPWKFLLKKGDIEKKAAWKDVDEKQGAYIDSWRYEIAAYRLDKLIGLNMVPITIEREFKGKKGALSLWADSKYSALKIMENNIRIPDWALKQTDDTKYIARFWDSLIANDDRTQENTLYTEDWRMILIDHSQAFRSNKENREKIMCGVNGIKRKDDGGPYLIQRIPRALFEKVKALDRTGLQQAMGPYLTDQEVEAIIARKPVLIKEIEEMIKKNGEKNVLY